MDAAAYLKKQGWRGTGHSLDHSDRGIKRPLQISKKVDALGVGIQKYGAVSDQWWMRAYDQGLKDLGTGKEGDLDKVRQHGHDRGGLYARFVKGQPIPGSIDEYTATTQSSLHRTEEKQGVKNKESPANSSKHSRPTTLDNTVQAKRRKVLVDDGSTAERATQCDNDIRMLVEGYVQEAVRRGIIPAKNAKKSYKTSPSRPDETDMIRVLALAGMSLTQQVQPSQRPHMVRVLKRAAMQHIEGASFSL